MTPRPETSLTGPDVRRHLSAVLPPHAMPSAITIGGQLPAPGRHKAAGAFRRTAPPPTPSAESTPLLAEFAALAHEALGTPIDVDGNFFDVGLTSITLLRFHRLVTTRLGLDLPVSALFTYPNLRTLAFHAQKTAHPEAPATAYSPPPRRPTHPTPSAARRRALRTLLSHPEPPEAT